MPGLTRGGRWRLDLQAAVDPGIELGWIDPDAAAVPAQELEPFVYERGMS